MKTKYNSPLGNPEYRLDSHINYASIGLFIIGLAFGALIIAFVSFLFI